MRQPPIEAAVEEERSQAGNPGPGVHGSRQIQRWEPPDSEMGAREAALRAEGEEGALHRIQ